MGLAQDIGQSSLTIEICLSVHAAISLLVLLEDIIVRFQHSVHMLLVQAEEFQTVHVGSMFVLHVRLKVSADVRLALLGPGHLESGVQLLDGAQGVFHVFFVGEIYEQVCRVPCVIFVFLHFITNYLIVYLYMQTLAIW